MWQVLQVVGHFINAYYYKYVAGRVGGTLITYSKVTLMALEATIA